MEGAGRSMGGGKGDSVGRERSSSNHEPSLASALQVS